MGHINYIIRCNRDRATLTALGVFTGPEPGYGIAIQQYAKQNVSYVTLREQDFVRYPLLSRLFADLREDPNAYAGGFGLTKAEVPEAERMFQELTARNPSASFAEGHLFVKLEEQIYWIWFSQAIDN